MPPRRIGRVGRVLPGAGPVIPVTPVRARAPFELREDEEADREDARREHARHAGRAEPPAPDPPAPGSAHVDVRA